MIEAYATGTQLTLDATRILGPLGDVVSASEKAQTAAANTQVAIDGMAASLGGAGRVAEGLAAACERAERAAGGARTPVAPGGAGGDPARAFVLPAQDPSDPAFPARVGGAPLHDGSATPARISEVYAVAEQALSGVARLIDAGKGLNDQLVILQQHGVPATDTATPRDEAFDIARKTPGRNVASALSDFADVRALLGGKLGDAGPIADAKAILPNVESTAAALHTVTGMDSESSLRMLLHVLEQRDGIVDPKTRRVSPELFDNELEWAYKRLVLAGTMGTQASEPQAIGEKERISKVPSREAALGLSAKGSIGFNFDAMSTAWSNMLQALEKANSSAIISVFGAVTKFFNLIPDDQNITRRSKEREKQYPGIGNFRMYPIGGYPSSDKRFWADQNQDLLQPNAYHPEEGNHYRPAIAPASGGGETLTFRGTVNLDGRKVGEVLAHALDRPGTGPSVTSVRSNPWFAESGVGAA